MKKTLLFAASALVLSATLAQTAAAKDGFYIAARIGQTDPNLNDERDKASDEALRDFDVVTMYSGALGYRYRYFRAEFEYIHRDEVAELATYPDAGNLSAKISSEATSYMLNGYIDFLPYYVVSPFIQAGIGMTDVSLTNAPTTAGQAPQTWEDNTLTWTVGAGLTVRLNKCVNIDAGYRYYDMGSIDHLNFNAHEYYAGLRYTF